MKNKLKIGFWVMMTIMLGIIVTQGSKSTLNVQAETITPNLHIKIDDAPVLIESKDTDKISASYNSKYYDVSIDQSLGGEWNVDISVIHADTNKSVVLYIPKTEYKSVGIEINNGMYSGGILSAENIIANVDNGGLDFTLDRNFDGSVEIDAYNSIMHLSSLDRYTNFYIEMNCDRESLGAAPSYFDCDDTNGKYTYFDGSGSNLMNIALQDGSVGTLE